MRIKLDEKHTLCTDKYCCWVMCKVTQKNKKTGKVTEYELRVSGYYPHFEQVVDDYISKKFKGSEAESLKELARELKEIKREMKAWTRSEDAEKLKSI